METINKYDPQRYTSQLRLSPLPPFTISTSTSTSTISTPSVPMPLPAATTTTTTATTTSLTTLPTTIPTLPLPLPTPTPTLTLTLTVTPTIPIPTPTPITTTATTMMMAPPPRTPHQLPRELGQRRARVAIPPRLLAARLAARLPRRNALADGGQAEDVEGLGPLQLATFVGVFVGAGSCGTMVVVAVVEGEFEGGGGRRVGGRGGGGDAEVEGRDLVRGGQAAGGAREEARVHVHGAARVEARGEVGGEEVGDVGEGVADRGHLPAV